MLRHRLDLGVDLMGGLFEDGERKGDIFIGGQRVEQIKVLKDKPELLPAEPGEAWFPMW